MAGSSGAPTRREVILEAAEALLKHYGFAKTTVADIARQAGVGVGTVYLEFASKEDIVAALAETRHERVAAAMRGAAAGPGSFADRIGRVLELRFESFARYAEEGQHGRDLVTCGCEAVGRVHAEFRALEQELLTSLISEGVAAGELAAEEPATAARMLARIYDGLLEEPRCRRDAAEQARVLRCLRHLLFQGLIQRSGGAQRS